MNKDIIYIEPEDDITDIVAKIKSAKQKVVALVPPKKLGVLTSAINVKLIAKTAKSTKKGIVLVTDHPALMKLAAAVELPVAATLQSRPSIPSSSDIETAAESVDNPTIEEAAEEAEKESDRNDIADDFASAPEQLDTSMIEDELAVRSVDENPIELSDEKDDDSDDTDDEDDENNKNDKDDDREDKKSDQKDQKDQKDKKDEKNDDKKSDKKSKDSKLPAFLKNRKIVIAGAAAIVVLILALIWAFAIAPAATVKVKVSTISTNFSENVSFTTDQAKEDAKSGLFFLEKIEKKESVKGSLKATEERDIGEKASGAVGISYTFDDNSSVTLAAGTTLAQGGKQYYTADAVTLSPDECKVSEIKAGSCSASAQVKIIAAAAGDSYNCENGTAFTVAVAGYSASATTAISGGSSKVVKVVQQSDINAAVESADKPTESDIKKSMKSDLKDGYILIDSSYKVTTGEAKPSVEIGAEAPEGATVSFEITYTIYAVDSARIEEYIREKAKLSSDQKIYELGSPYIERFTEADGGSITGKLKTTYKVGPEVTDEKVLEKVRGKKVGEAQSILKSINGVSSVDIKTSFFWVNSIPDDPNKITINIEVEE